jgi:membrane AbrB-like protein
MKLMNSPVAVPATGPAPPNPAAPDRRTLALHWAGLLAASIVCALLLRASHVSAALLLGPIAAAIFFAARESPVRVPVPAFVFAQAIVGCMIARTLPFSLLGEIGKSWPLFVAAVGSVVFASAALGWVMARWRVLPGTTAVWGSFPGAATAMVLMAEAFGADVRLVALMQYLRVLLVGIAATTVTRIWVPVHAAAAPLIPASAPLHAVAFGATLALAGAGAWIGVRLRVPAGGLLVPLFAGVVLQDSGLLAIELPWWLLAACYALVGWSIGLRFTPSILRPAARLLPRALAGIVALIVLCGGLAWLLARFAHVDPLTAYLATSPGGADTVAIIASSSPVDVPFVMAMQSARFIVVAFCGPALARFVARRVPE